MATKRFILALPFPLIEIHVDITICTLFDVFTMIINFDPFIMIKLNL